MLEAGRNRAGNGSANLGAGPAGSKELQTKCRGNYGNRKLDSGANITDAQRQQFSAQRNGSRQRTRCNGLSVGNALLNQHAKPNGN